jgi:hypothetical protein
MLFSGSFSRFPFTVYLYSAFFWVPHTVEPILIGYLINSQHFYLPLNQHESEPKIGALFNRLKVRRFMPSNRENQTFQGSSFSVIVDLDHYKNVYRIHAKTTGSGDYFGWYAPSFQMIIISSDGGYKAQ